MTFQLPEERTLSTNRKKPLTDRTTASRLSSTSLLDDARGLEKVARTLVGSTMNPDAENPDGAETSHGKCKARCVIVKVEVFRSSQVREQRPF